MLAVAGIAIAGLVWYGFFSGSSSSDQVLTTASTDGVADSLDQGLVNTLLTLRAITLSGSIFSEPVFQELQDFSTEIVPEPVGRPNPFAPLSPVSLIPSDTSSANSKLFLRVAP